ncbi:Chromatin modification-related protein EAF3 [Orchesella cincta]|uniref:Chromatin modification-related protein EAF3 n=1 Tax=Orchesella cincta TaxID=48709 RepID=A0A1D2M202_ORCCI|nr:Chromatin modification-related protein EAF3 [Orchesella cincta]
MMRRKQKKPEQVLNVREARNEDVVPAPETGNKGRKRKRSPTPSLTDVIVQSTGNSKRTTRSSMKQTIAILEQESEISCNDSATAIIVNPEPQPNLLTSPQKDEEAVAIPILEPTPALSTPPNLEQPLNDADEKPTYNTGDKVLCHFQNLLYDAIILNIHPISDYRKLENCDIEKTFRSKPRDNNEKFGIQENTADDFGYFIHYCQLEFRLDEWVRSDCFVPITENTKAQQRELKKLAAKNKNKPKKSVGRKRRKSTTLTKKLAPSINGDAQEPDELESLNQVTHEDVGIMLDVGSCIEKSVPSSIEEVPEPGELLETLNQLPLPHDDVGIMLDVGSFIEKSVPLSIKEVPETGELETFNQVSNEDVGIMQDVGSFIENSAVPSSNEQAPEPGELLETFNPASHEYDGIILEFVGPIERPTISEAVKDLAESMLGSHSDKITVEAYTMKLLMFYDYFCRSLISDDMKQNVLAAMDVKKTNNYSDVVHFSGLVKFLKWIANGKVEDWKLYYRKDLLVDELNEIRQIFEVFKDLFDETMAYFNITQKYTLPIIGLKEIKTEPPSEF